MSNNENNFNPDCAEDERLMRQTPDAGKAIRQDERKLKNDDDPKRPLFVSEMIERSTKRITDSFKDSWTVVSERHSGDPIGARLMNFHRVTAEIVGSTKPALMDIVMSQINSTILPLLSEDERKELDRVTTDDVMHDMVKSILK